MLCEAKDPDLAQVRHQRVLLMGPGQKDLPEAELCKGIRRSGLGFVTIDGAGGNAGAGVGGEVDVDANAGTAAVDEDGNEVAGARGPAVPRHVSPMA